VKIGDLQQLYRMGSDPSVVAARAQSTPKSTSAPLLRRLKAWGAKAVDSLREQQSGDEAPVRGLQMVRRPHLQLLASRGGERYELEAERITAHSHLRRESKPQVAAIASPSHLMNDGFSSVSH
jgi:hypothetical protein